MYQQQSAGFFHLGVLFNFIIAKANLHFSTTNTIFSVLSTVWSFVFHWELSEFSGFLKFNLMAEFMSDLF